MSYLEFNIKELDQTRKKIIEAVRKQRINGSKWKERINVGHASSRKSRKILAVDSGFNSAYETAFTIFKAAMVNENMDVDEKTKICYFQVDNHQTDRLKRLIMQETLYETLIKTIGSGEADNNIAIVDGTITLTIFHPTTKDSTEYKNHFRSLVTELYTPLVEECLRRNIILLGFLKRTGSTYLADHLKARDLYDRHITNTVLQTHGEYIKPIPMSHSGMGQQSLPFEYVTFYLNLKGWNYRFELLRQQELIFADCAENLLFWSTRIHFGMNPIFSKADEHARVTKRKANLIFNYIISDLPNDVKSEILLETQKRTHFGYHRGNKLGGLIKHDS